MGELRQRGLALGTEPQQLVDRIGEFLRRHEGAQQSLDAWAEGGHSEPIGDYMRATRQVVELVVRAVVARIDLWLQGESALANASSAHASFMAQPRNNHPFDLARTISLEEVRQLALDTDEVAWQCITVDQATSGADAEQPAASG